MFFMQQPAIPKKNHDIEVLRTVAIVFVILAHVAGILSPDSLYWRILDYARFGSGVDLFFCVSGFIITSSILSTVPKDKSLSAFVNFTVPFWKKRFWRLMPSAIFWIVIVLLLASIWGGKGQIIPFESMSSSALHALTQTQNFYFIECRPAGTCGELGIYWSLSLENQFYLLLPLLAFFLTDRKLALFFFIVFLTQVFLPRTLNAATPVMWPLRTDAVALGVIIAIFAHNAPSSRPCPRLLESKTFCAGAFMIALLLLALLSSPQPLLSFSVGITAVVSGFLVLLASYNRGCFSSHPAVRVFCDYIGSRSYSIYLTHVVALALTKILFFSAATRYDGLHTALYLTFFLTATLLMSEFNYRIIEMPLRALGRKNKPKKPVAPFV
jgi:peptidoglycan/LPS O-acetylase OafA/YrhL